MTLSPLSLLIAVAVLTVAGVVIVRRFGFKPQEDGGAIGSLIIPCLLSIYLIAVAMGIVIGWENNRQAADDVVAEATTATDLYWSTTTFPSGSGEQVRRELRTYVETVIRNDWPEMRHGELSPAGDSALGRLRASVAEVPTSDQAAALDRMVARQEVSGLVDKRIERADSAQAHIPRTLVLITAITALAIAALPFGMGGTRTRAGLFWSVTNLVIVVSTVAALLFLDNPYAGLIPVESEPLEQALVGFDRIDQVTGRL
ncbi:DUF4239 domain-containing protein [Nocardiopsis gilva YIM 90087]|uniref:DUF4239 domain-containing protein n=1 Tax=Nocardiopsis gilva YIM 90087 TaxID=1235441 RepID=A0A223S2R6_9ACTN|nr:DUF4239 domain-containing protein [Nocardiopsis gilva]ASU82426.1 DUF4239 domain-containing protein [Nocardiopsis gilva YIM 90087]